MTKKIRSYASDELTVDYDASRCIHAAECVHGLPAVFDPKRRPWIAAEQASRDELAAVIERCPTGALKYTPRDGGPPESAPTSNCVRVVKNGPLHVTGRLRVTLPGGETLDETRVAFCRCGQSANKPFCDNAHAAGGFSDPARVPEGKLKAGAPDDDATLRITLAQNGPVLLRGPVELRGAGEAAETGAGCALCRCGHSANKPFCDGSHTRAGFVAD